MPEDLNPGPSKIEPYGTGYIVHNVSGIRTHIVSRLDGKGYDVTKCTSIMCSFFLRILTIFEVGPHSVHFGQLVYINDTSLRLASVVENGPTEETVSKRPHSTSIRLRFSVARPETALNELPFDAPPIPEDLVTPAFTAFFGGDLSAPPEPERRPLRMAHPSGARLTHDPSNPLGCLPYDRYFDNAVVIVTRGNCTFLEKLIYARDAGASGVLVASDVDSIINPSATTTEILIAGDLSDAAVLILKALDAKQVAEMMIAAAKRQSYVIVTLEHPTIQPQNRHSLTGTEDPVEEEPRVLYLNGHALLNTRLLI